MNPPWPLIIVVYRFVVVQWSSVGNQIDIKLVWLWTCTGTGTGFKRFDICALKINKEFDEILHLFPFVVVVVVVVADDVESRGDRSRQTALEIPMMTIVGPMNVVAGTWNGAAGGQNNNNNNKTNNNNYKLRKTQTIST